MAHHRHRVYSKSKSITLLNVQPTAQQMHASYLLMTRAHDQGHVPGHVHKVRERVLGPSFAAIFIQMGIMR